MKYLLILIALIVSGSAATAQKIAGLLQSKEGATDGLMLFAPLMSKTTYLIDDCGRVINTWQSEFQPGNTVYLLPNGNLFRTNRLANATITGGGGGGGMEILTWNSVKLWSYTINSETQRQHHDAVILPNGNIVTIIWELKSEQEALTEGRNPAQLADKVVWSERIVELKPIFPDGAQIVWEWSLWDHLIQDFDQTKENYGVVEDHPELVNLNYTQTPTGTNDWVHANSIDYNPDLDQIVLSSPFLNEFWIIDHSTTTAEAASHSGGDRGKGGDLLYRWGNPQAYKRGSAADRKLFGQHHVHWIAEGLPSEGSIMVFNNQHGENHSTVDIINPSKDDQGEYTLEDGKFGPVDQDHVYEATPPESLNSPIMSSAEMLPNGNLLICSSIQGQIFEVNTAEEIVWEYKSPVTTNGIVGRDLPADQPFISDRNFRAIKYPRDFVGFTGKDLSPGEPIEGEPWPECAIPLAVEDNLKAMEMYPNPAEDKLYIKHPNGSAHLSVKLLTAQGIEIKSATGVGEIVLDISNVASGVLIAVVNNTPHKIIKVK
ncbi:MAG TPA: aryl-sulfate sulfotransferase [Chryseolinea sp.]